MEFLEIIFQAWKVMDFSVWSWKIVVLVMKMNKVYQIMDDLDYFKKSLDLIKIWLGASHKVRKLTQSEALVQFYFQ